jgi:hypothetical protein
MFNNNDEEDKLKHQKIGQNIKTLEKKIKSEKF